MKLSVKLPLLAVTGVLVASVVGGAFAITRASHALLSQASDEAERVLAAYLDGIEAVLDSATRALEMSRHDAELAAFPAASEIRPSTHGIREAADPHARAWARAAVGDGSMFERVTLLLPDGRVYLAEPFAQQRALTVDDLAFTSWFAQVRRTRATTMSDLVISPATQRPTVDVVVPMIDGAGRVGAIWVGSLRLEALSAFGSADLGAAGRGETVYLTDRRGFVVADHSRPELVAYQTDLRANPPVRAALAGGSGTMEWTSLVDGRRKIGAYRPTRAGWAAVEATDLSLALAPVRGLTRSIAIGSALTALVAAVASALFVRRLVAPVKRLTEATEAITAGSLTGRVRIHAGGEIGELASRFDRMAVTIARNEASLRRQAEKLEAANQELAAFAYSVSHDLRAPLRAIDGFGAALIEDHGQALDQDARALLDRIRAAAGRMGVLIDDLLRLSRISRAEMRMAPVDLSAMASEIGEELRAAHAHAVRFDVMPDVRVYGDPGLLRVALENLLDNAWKFTGGTPEPAVEFGFVHNGVAAIYVRDNGVGFDPAFAGRLFGAFQRLHPRTEFEGNGIGLATVRRIISRHGGVVWAEATPGAGATFSFSIPGRTEGTS